MPTETPKTATTPPAKPVSHKAPLFALLFPQLTETARAHGYALGLHGSLNRDLDLIAVPWVKDAKPAKVLIEAFRQRVDGMIIRSGTPGGRWSPTLQKFVTTVIRTPSHRPHGRRTWSIHFSESNFYLDVSVMPRRLRKRGRR